MSKNRHSALPKPNLQTVPEQEIYEDTDANDPQLKSEVELRNMCVYLMNLINKERPNIAKCLESEIDLAGYKNLPPGFVALAKIVRLSQIMPWEFSAILREDNNRWRRESRSEFSNYYAILQSRTKSLYPRGGQTGGNFSAL